MNRATTPRGNLASLVILAAVFTGLCAGAQSVQHLSVPQTGGMPGRPVMTGMERTTNGALITWDGPPGYYQLYKKAKWSDSWQTVGRFTNLARCATITGLSSNAFFRVAGPTAQYAGARVCLECHSATYAAYTNTPHAKAFDALKQIGQDKNTQCLPCHTVGQGLPTGFVNATNTPHLEGVQCENCHGPAANHAANPADLAVRPRVEIAATMCGGCHTGSHTPTFEEWKSSEHATVVQDMNPADKINACGRCHSGSARLSLLNGTAMPTGDANVGLGCVTCHNPHQTTANPFQLRNPIASTNDYSIAPSDNFAQKYNPNINLCAQCHNDGGASWTNYDAAPHFSPQYNMLLGRVGVLDSGLVTNQPAAHGLLITNQCVGCHMQTQAQPAVTGHSFKVQIFDLCRNCHPQPEPLIQFVGTAISNQVQQVKAGLDSWAATKAPDALRTKYGARAWEYATPGDLSGAGPSPTLAEQPSIPENIRKARFNLYMVYHDRSQGVHNGPLAVDLLEAAQGWIEEELSR